MNNARLSYSPETFVDREAETALVEGLTRHILQGETKRPRALMFQGERGSGKSWFSLHLAPRRSSDHPWVVPTRAGRSALCKRTVS